MIYDGGKIMFERTDLLQLLFEQYNIDELPFGVKQDKLGDVMEDYCVKLLNSSNMLEKLKSKDIDYNNADDFLFWSIIEELEIDADSIIDMHATRDIEHRSTGGNAKTDVLLTIRCFDETINVPISVKQTTVAKVAMAEFDAETIFREVGITDPIVQELILKHQTDASAINFTPEEKRLLTDGLKPYAKSFVRWVLTGTPEDTDDLRFPKIIVKMNMSREDEINDIYVYSVDNYVKSVMYDRRGNIRAGGFGTGLSWTYATGSKGRKIQFKG